MQQFAPGGLLAGALFGWVPLPWWRRVRKRIRFPSFLQQAIVAGRESQDREWILVFGAAGFCLLDLLFHLEKQVFHLKSPGLFEFLFHKGEFTQMMGVTQRMLA